MSPTTRPTTDVRSTMSELWRTRPARRQSERMLTGVSGALARRYDIDPVLVRIGFVVAAFYGIGVPVYLAAWVALPADPADPPRGAALAGSVVRAVVYAVLAVATLGGIFALAQGELDFLIGLLVVGGLLYLLQTTRGEHGLELARATAAPVTANPPGIVGAPAPGGRPRPPRPPRSRVTPVTMASALLAAGVGGAVLLIGGGGPPGPRLVVGVLLAVVGAGLIVGSFTRGGRGLIALALPLLLVGWAVTRPPVQNWQGAGELRAAPTSPTQVAATYQRTFGRVELDLRGLDLGAGAPAQPPAPDAPGAPAQSVGEPVQPVRTSVRVELGEAVVRVPPNADVRVRCFASVGEVDCLGVPETRAGADGAGRDGPSAQARVDDLGADRVAGGRPLDIDATVGTGSVEVRRG